MNIEIAVKWKFQFCLFFFNPKQYLNEIWSNTSVADNKYFQHVYSKIYFKLQKT